MQIHDEDMQMVRDWLEEAKAPEYIKGHFENLVEHHAKEADSAATLRERVDELESVEADEIGKLETRVGELEDELDEISARRNARRTRNREVLVAGRACPRSTDAETAADDIENCGGCAVTTHIMCDLETICKRPGGVVLAAAFVRFSDEAHCTLNLSVPDQEALGLERDPETQAWWNDQEAKHPGAWAAATSNPYPLATALPHFLEWIRWAAPDGDFLLWCHGATFDGPILGEVYRRAATSTDSQFASLRGIACPWTEQFWRVQCTRTLFNLSGINPKDYAVPPPHVALNDAIGQTRAANAALRRIGSALVVANGHV